MTEQDLDGAYVASRPVDHRCLGATKRVCSKFLRTQTNRGHPFVDQARVLPSAHVAGVIDAARERIVFDGTSSAFKPSLKAGSDVAGNLELDRPSRLLLNDDCASTNLWPSDDIADPDLDQVTAGELAVDC